MVDTVRFSIGRMLLLAGLVLAVATTRPATAASTSDCDCAPAVDAQTGEVYECCWCDNGSGTCSYICDDPGGTSGSFPC